MIKLAFLLLFNYAAAEWKPLKDIPFEFEGLIHSASKIKSDDDYQRSLKKSLGKVFSFYSRIDKKEFYYVFKVSTYKYLLREKPETRIPVNYYNSPYLNKFIRNKPPTYLNNFPLWVWKALVKDIDMITRDPNYFRYVEAKKKGETNEQYNRLDKRIKLILPWLIHMKVQTPEEFDIFMKQHYLSILDHAALNMKIYATLKGIKNADYPEKFDLSPYVKIEKKANKPKKADDIKTINNIVKDVTEESLPEPTGDWELGTEEFLPKDETILPDPVDDWFDEL